MLSLFLVLAIVVLNCLFAGPLVVVLVTMLFMSIVSGYAFPEYTADLVQKMRIKMVVNEQFKPVYDHF